jgi:hypothetical protein
MSSIAQPLTTHECTLLSAHEAQIERGLQTFYDVGTALLAIRDQRLYRATFATFEAYCRERWGMERRRAYQLIEAAEAFESVQNFTHSPPANEAQARSLTAVPPAERAEVWQEAVATAPNGKVTAAHVADVVQRHIAPPVVPVVDVVPVEDPALIVVPPVVDVVPLADHQRINLSTSNEWYTPAQFVEAARQVMGGIDLDPASCAFANQVVKATRYYTQDDDGMAQRWYGRVWMNPPYGREEGERDSNQARWTRRLLEAYQAGDVTEAIMLVNAVPGNRWFVPLKAYPICFPDARIRFYNEETDAGQPTHSNALIYLGSHLARFRRVFSVFGAVMGTVDVWRNYTEDNDECF